MLRVSVNIKQGVYIISEDDGKKIIEVPMNGMYSKENAIAIREEIKKSNRHIVAKEKLESIDVGLYQALKQYDSQYGTNHSYNYADALGREILDSFYSIRDKDYKEKMAEIRGKELEKAGINIQYNVSLFSKAKRLGLGEHIQAVRQAFKQKRNGAKVQVSNSKKPLLEAPAIIDKEEDIPAMPNAEVLRKMKQEEKTKVQPIVSSEPPKAEPIIVIDPKAKAPQPESKGTPVVQGINEEKEDEFVIGDAMNGRRVAAVTRPPQEKKKLSRSKSIQASKKAQREAGKMKNRYKDVIKAKAEKRAEAERRAAEGPKPKAEIKPEQIVPPEPDPIVEEPKIEEKKPERKLVLSSKGAIAHEYVTRFTRKIKDQADSIRNKIHIPKMNPTKIKGATTVTAIALTAALGIGAIAGLHGYLESRQNAHKDDAKGPQIVEQVKRDPNVDKDGIEYILENNKTQTQTPTKDLSTQTPTQTPVTQAPVQGEGQTQTSEQDDQKEYLSSIKVGTALNITSGKYFETPEGQGNYGYFENFTDGTKIIQYIDVMTDEGYIIIKDDSVSLYELKQQYPNAKFSYHMVCQSKDGTTRTLGWLTEDSLDQNKEQSQQQIGRQHQAPIDVDEGDR